MNQLAYIRILKSPRTVQAPIHERLKQEVQQIRRWLAQNKADRQGSRGAIRLSNRTDKESAKVAMGSAGPWHWIGAGFAEACCHRHPSLSTRKHRHCRCCGLVLRSQSQGTGCKGDQCLPSRQGLPQTRCALRRPQPLHLPCGQTALSQRRQLHPRRLHCRHIRCAGLPGE